MKKIIVILLFSSALYNNCGEQPVSKARKSFRDLLNKDTKDAISCFRALPDNQKRKVVELGASIKPPCDNFSMFADPSFGVSSPTHPFLEFLSREKFAREMRRRMFSRR